jgi:hypothetical protein
MPNSIALQLPGVARALRRIDPAQMGVDAVESGRRREPVEGTRQAEVGPRGNQRYAV